MQVVPDHVEPWVALHQREPHFRENPDTADSEEKTAGRRLTAFQQGLQQLGWSDGRNIQIGYRFGGGNAALIRRNARAVTGGAVL